MVESVARPLYRLVLVVGLALLAVPAPAAAGGSVRRVAVPLTVTGQAGGWTVLRSVAVPGGFALVGLHWRGAKSARLAVRTATAAGRFGPWRELDRLAGETVVGASYVTDPLWAGRAARIQVRLRGSVQRVTAVTVLPGPDPTLQAVKTLAAAPDQPEILPRTAWGADESLRTAEPVIAGRLQAAVIHHTATPNGYDAAQAPRIVRSIYLYHVRGNGWADIGYNFLVDAQGRVYEGRFGGVGQNVVGAHTEGFNRGTVGVALIGDFDRVAPSAAQRSALERLLAWRLDVGHVDPAGQVTLVSEGGGKFAKGRSVEFPTILGHRDAYKTTCPGQAAYGLLAGIRTNAAKGGPRILEPSIEPPQIAAPFQAIRFRARLSKAAPWKVTVATTAGAAVAEITGSGAAVDAVWTGTVAGGGPLPKPSLLVWRITTAGARTAEGSFDGSVGGQTPTPSPSPPSTAVAAVVSAPAALVADSPGKLMWQQVTRGLVRVTVTTAAGAEIAVLRETAPAEVGTHEVTWPGLVASGHYRYLIRVQPDGSSTVDSVTSDVDVRRQASGLRAPAGVSPNGDGLADAATIEFVRAEAGDAQVRLLRAGKLVKNVALLYDQAPGPFTYQWAPRGLRDGRYELQLLVPGVGGPVEFRAPIRLDTVGPAVRLRKVRAVSPRKDLVVFVRVTEAGTVEIRRGATVLRTVTAKKGVVRITLERALVGTARTLTAVARDGLGNASRRPATIRVPG